MPKDTARTPGPESRGEGEGVLLRELEAFLARQREALARQKAIADFLAEKRPRETRGLAAFFAGHGLLLRACLFGRRSEEYALQRPFGPAMTC